MLRNLEKNVIFRAIITKKILHKSKKRKRFRVSLSAQAIVRFSAGLKWSLFLLRASDTTNSADLFCRTIRCTISFAIQIIKYIFFISLIDTQPKMGQINLRKKMIFLRNLEDFLRK